jgi:hypothetical protein
MRAAVLPESISSSSSGSPIAGMFASQDI